MSNLDNDNSLSGSDSPADHTPLTVNKQSANVKPVDASQQLGELLDVAALHQEDQDLGAFHLRTTGRIDSNLTESSSGFDRGSSSWEDASSQGTSPPSSPWLMEPRGKNDLFNAANLALVSGIASAESDASSMLSDGSTDERPVKVFSRESRDLYRDMRDLLGDDLSSMHSLSDDEGEVEIDVEKSIHLVPLDATPLPLVVTQTRPVSDDESDVEIDGEKAIGIVPLEALPEPTEAEQTLPVIDDAGGVEIDGEKTIHLIPWDAIPLPLEVAQVLPPSHALLSYEVLTYVATTCSAEELEDYKHALRAYEHSLAKYKVLVETWQGVREDCVGSKSGVALAISQSKEFTVVDQLLQERLPLLKSAANQVSEALMVADRRLAILKLDSVGAAVISEDPVDEAVRRKLRVAMEEIAESAEVSSSFRARIAGMVQRFADKKSENARAPVDPKLLESLVNAKREKAFHDALNDIATNHSPANDVIQVIEKSPSRWRQTFKVMRPVPERKPELIPFSVSERHFIDKTIAAISVGAIADVKREAVVLRNQNASITQQWNVLFEDLAQGQIESKQIESRKELLLNDELSLHARVDRFTKKMPFSIETHALSSPAEFDANGKGLQESETSSVPATETERNDAFVAIEKKAIADMLLRAAIENEIPQLVQGWNTSNNYHSIPAAKYLSEYSGTPLFLPPEGYGPSGEVHIMVEGSKIEPVVVTVQPHEIGVEKIPFGDLSKVTFVGGRLTSIEPSRAITAELDRSIRQAIGDLTIKLDVFNNRNPPNLYSSVKGEQMGDVKMDCWPITDVAGTDLLRGPRGEAFVVNMQNPDCPQVVVLGEEHLGNAALPALNEMWTVKLNGKNRADITAGSRQQLDDEPVIEIGKDRRSLLKGIKEKFSSRNYKDGLTTLSVEALEKQCSVLKVGAGVRVTGDVVHITDNQHSADIPKGTAYLLVKKIPERAVCLSIGEDNERYLVRATPELTQHLKVPLKVGKMVSFTTGEEPNKQSKGMSRSSSKKSQG